MGQNAKWSQFLEDNEQLRAIIAGSLDLPVCPKKSDQLQDSLLKALAAAREIYDGELEKAAQLLAKTSRQGRSYCLRLVRYWLQAETEDAEVIYRRLTRFIAELERSSRRYAFVLKQQLEIREIQAARRWAPVLRLYVATLLPQWPADVLQTARQDMRVCEKNAIGPDLILYLRYMLRFARARHGHNTDEIVNVMDAWHRLEKDSGKAAIGHDFYLETALTLEADGRFDEAVRWLDKALELVPGNYDFLLTRARVTKRTGDFRRSLVSCESLIEKFPEDFAGYCLRSNINFLLGNYDMAMHDANRACSIAPVSPDAFMARAFVFLQMGRYEKALSDFRQVLEIDPLRYEALRGQGKCLSMLGRDFEALTCFTAMRRQWPEDPDLYYELADILFAAGYLDDCTRMCRRCLTIDSTYVSAYVILGMVALRRNDDEEAKNFLTRAVALEPDNPFALNELSYLKHLEGDDDMAIELVNRAIEESPDYHDALCNKGVILYYRSDFEQAIQVFDQVLSLEPEQAAAWVGKGNSLTQLSDYDAALSCYDEALTLDPNNADACHGKAVLYRMIGLEDEVRRWQERALSIDPDIEDV